ncbi:MULTISPECIES: conjugal transfer protein TraF [Halorhodospira]|uniref:conjugal transfer protein TraF n=1 Tax=Halorhodospira TaxID=85108 RepID=UPI001EE91A24|nr:MULTISPECIES: conjugal transfer protein TraF [Halorhodospira]MCG5528890.1 conjugal transfer protein TraF [Halorhodospira halophila]MCG5544276.1 conjugal transfer protein TraF [Halorhodospira sp. 9628]
MRRHTLPVAALAALLPLTATANHQPPGSALGFGDATRFADTQGSKQNPAGPIAGSERGVRMGVFSLGLSYEVGDVSDFGDDFEDLGGEFDELEQKLEAVDEDTDIDELEDDLQTLETNINEILDRIADDGYLTAGVTGQFVPFPFETTQDALRGSLLVDLEYSARGHLSVLRGEDLDLDVGSQQEAEEALEELDGFGGYIRSAITRTFTLGYGTTVYDNPHGLLFAGAQLKHHQVELSRMTVGFDDDAGSKLSDEFGENSQTDSDFGVDLGVMWVGDWYRAGASIANLVEPTFDYPAVEDEATYDQATERGEIDPDEYYRMERQLNLEGAVHTADGRWLLGGSLDLNAADGPFADGSDDAYQWLTVGGAYRPPHAALPGWRLGYRQNLAGSEIGYITGGVTLFRVLTLDAAMSTETVDSVPRAFMFNAGVGVRF